MRAAKVYQHHDGSNQYRPWKGPKMAATTIAGKWVEANGGWISPSNPLPKNQRTQRTRAALRRHKDKEVFAACDLEARALDVLAANEVYAHKSRKFTVKRFVEKNVTATADYCIFVPLAREWAPASVTVDGINMPAARYMCSAAHGEPEAGMVARHLCGNGHLSCVNPAHLAWGTAQQNARDRSLHTDRPIRFPTVSDDTKAAIRQDKRLANILAIEHNIPSHLIAMIRASA